MSPEHTYRDFTLDRLTKENCARFLKALAVSGGSITSCFSLSKGFPIERVNYNSMFFRLKFVNHEALSKFHSYGLQTTTIENFSSYPN